MQSAGDMSRMQHGGAGISETLTFGPAGVPPEIVVDAELGLGQIVVRSAS